MYFKWCQDPRVHNFPTARKFIHELRWNQVHGSRAKIYSSFPRQVVRNNFIQWSVCIQWLHHQWTRLKLVILHMILVIQKSRLCQIQNQWQGSFGERRQEFGVSLENPCNGVGVDLPFGKYLVVSSCLSHIWKAPCSEFVLISHSESSLLSEVFGNPKVRP